MQTEKVIQKKWGAALDAGFQVVPNILIRAQSQLGLDAIDIVVLLNLTAHWWTKEDLPFITPSGIARRMNVATRTVERHLKKLEKGGLLRRCNPERSDNGIYRRTYDLRPLAAVLQKESAKALLLRKPPTEHFQDLDHEEHVAANQRPQVQSNGDAEPVQRVASAIPTGEGLGNPGPHVVTIKDTGESPEDQQSKVDAAALLSKFRDDDWEERLAGKACPVCSLPFEPGHQCGKYDSAGGDVPF